MEHVWDDLAPCPFGIVTSMGCSAGWISVSGLSIHRYLVGKKLDIQPESTMASCFLGVGGVRREILLHNCVILFILALLLISVAPRSQECGGWAL